MYLGQNDVAILKSDSRDAFLFAPTASAVPLTQAGEFTDAGAAGNSLDSRDIADDFEVHATIVPNLGDQVKWPWRAA